MINLTFETALQLELDRMDAAYEDFKALVKSPTVLNPQFSELRSSLSILGDAADRIIKLKQVAADAKELAVKANFPLP